MHLYSPPLPYSLFFLSRPPDEQKWTPPLLRARVFLTTPRLCVHPQATSSVLFSPILSVPLFGSQFSFHSFQRTPIRFLGCGGTGFSPRTCFRFFFFPFEYSFSFSEGLSLFPPCRGGHVPSNLCLCLLLCFRFWRQDFTRVRFTRPNCLSFFPVGHSPVRGRFKKLFSLVFFSFLAGMVRPFSSFLCNFLVFNMNLHLAPRTICIIFSLLPPRLSFPFFPIAPRRHLPPPFRH